MTEIKINTIQMKTAVYLVTVFYASYENGNFSRASFMQCTLKMYFVLVSLPEEKELQSSNPKRLKKSRIWNWSGSGISSKLM